MTDQFEIIWNGTHQNRDEDLLCAELRIPEKRPGGPLHSDQGQTRARLLAVLPTSRLQALTFRELIHLTGCSADAVNGTLYVLRQQGILCSVPMPGLPYRSSRPPQLYWQRSTCHSAPPVGEP